MAALNPYLNFNGNCEEAFNFYKSVFGGEFASLMRFNNAPAEYNQNPAEAQRIMHVALPVGGNVLMGSDAPATYNVSTGTNFSVSVSTASKEEADGLFAGLSNGGKVSMAMADTFWGSYFGMLTDKFGINWMISFDKARS